MPKVLEDRCGLPHHDYLAQVVAELEAIGRGPDTWRLDEGPADGPALQALLNWRIGPAHALAVNWDTSCGWSYSWDFDTDEDSWVELDVHPVADPAGLARTLEYMLDATIPGPMPLAACWPGAGQLDDAVRAWTAARR
ncbi:hypothetical protein ACIA8O_38960 [Kitasatospora sp. NPDC051853]|uniref:hypothetical protein n=1 Tax=Kitasatospora sp. NPDC051853 TaxID=3364058 RepID=UPI0037B10F5C